jgi:hypothetical protein
MHTYLITFRSPLNGYDSIALVQAKSTSEAARKCRGWIEIETVA